MYLILFKNSRGLFTKTSKYGYLYPDRSCRDSVESGIVSCTDINMKGAYGFIKCETVTNTGSVLNAIKDGVLSLHDAFSIPVIYSINGIEFWASDSRIISSTKYYSYVNNKIIELDCNLINMEQDRPVSGFKVYNTYEYLLPYMLEYDTITSSNRAILIENIIRCLTGQEEDIGVCKGIVRIIRNKGCHTKSFCYYLFDGVSLYLLSTDGSVDKLKKLRYISIKKEIKNIFISYSLTFNFTDSDWDFREYIVSVFNQDVSRLFLSNKRFSFSTYDTYKDILELSKNEVEEFRKRALKQVSKRNLGDILKLSFNCALGDF